MFHTHHFRLNPAVACGRRSSFSRGSGAGHAVKIKVSDTDTRTSHHPTRRRDVPRFPQPSCTAMECPSLLARLIQPYQIQTAAGVSFEVAHYPYRRNLPVQYRMQVIASRMHLPNRLHYDVATDLLPGYREPDPSVPVRLPRVPNPRPGLGSPAHCARGRRRPIRWRVGGVHL